MLLTVSYLILTGLKCPLFVTPGSDYLKIRKLKTHLIISLSRSSVANGSCALFACYFYEALSYYGTSHACAEKIFILVHGMSLYAGKDIIITELIRKILYIKLFGAGKLCALLKPVKLLLLTDVCTNADNIVVVILLKPGDNCCCIKTA